MRTSRMVFEQFLVARDFGGGRLGWELGRASAPHLADIWPECLKTRASTGTEAGTLRRDRHSRHAKIGSDRLRNMPYPTDYQSLE